MLIGSVAMTILLSALLYTMCRLSKKAPFSFVIKLCILCIVSDFAFLILTLCFYCEQTKVHDNHTKALASMIGMMSFIYNYGSNLMHWLFSFKYWVIAKEVPKLFDSKQINFKEGSYRVIQSLGCIINLLPCGLIAFYRAKLTVQSADEGKPTNELVNTVQGVYFCITAL